MEAQGADPIERIESKLRVALGFLMLGGPVFCAVFFTGVILKGLFLAHPNIAWVVLTLVSLYAAFYFWKVEKAKVDKELEKKTPNVMG